MQGVDLAVQKIILDVRENGDKALFRYSREFDQAELTAIEVSPMEVENDFRQADPQLVEILYMAAERIYAFHQKQRRFGFQISEEPGVILGQKVLPLDRVGVYVPGGTAAYPSSVLMNCIPAKIAGVREVVMVTPPGQSGMISPAILAAAKIAGVDRLFRVGGAQAVAALAFGTESIPKVDKIVGPGNRYVAEAKKQVFGLVDIDMIAGPSEILVIADESARPDFLAADLLSQAEHDVNATAVLITPSASLAKEVQKEVEVQLLKLSRHDITRESVDENGKIIVVSSLGEAIAMANTLAPEHLELCVQDPFSYLSEIRNAGSVFLGHYCPEALGDYYAGPNHTLPTNGTARFASPLSVDDFVKTMQYSYYSKEALGRSANTVSYFALKEGLSGHAESVSIRMREEK